MELVLQFKLHQLKNDNKLKLKDIAEKTGLDIGFISDLANGKIKRLDLQKLLILCNLFNCDTNDVIGVIRKKELKSEKEED